MRPSIEDRFLVASKRRAWAEIYFAIAIGMLAGLIVAVTFMVLFALREAT